MQATLRQEQIKMLYSYWPSIVYGSFCIVIIVSIILWPIADKTMLVGWVVVNLILIAFRRNDLKQYANATVEHQDANHGQAASIFRLYSLANGILWGLVPVLFFHTDIEYFSLILVIHGGYVAASMAATAGYDQRSFYAFLVPSTTLFILGTLLNGGKPYWPHALLLSFYPFVITGFALKFNRSMREQLELRIENAELMANLREQRDRAEQAMLAKNRFLAAASHDLRQPVHALGLFVGSLEPHLNASEPRKIIAKIKQTNAALSSLFHGLLDISKLDANVVENAPQHIKLDGIFEEVLSEYIELARQKSIQLDVELPSTHTVYVDPALFGRIIRNLFGNAVNHTDNGSVRLSVKPASSEYWSVQVIDTGKGIPENELENIFSEYHQLENPERDRQKGLGLGLAIVRRLCLLMNLQLKVESTLASGSTFTLLVPAGDSEKIKQVEKSSYDENNHIGCKNVIVIDDETDILKGMEIVLNSWGCVTTIADSGNAAMSALDVNEPPEIIIADFRLRNNESGLDVIQAIRDEFNTEIPAVLITGDTAPERLQQAAEASVQVLHKPVKPEELKSILGQLTTANQQR